MATLVNRAKVSTATTGTGTITLGSAVSGFQTFAAAGVSNGATVSYAIEDGLDWEIGTGTYNSTGPTLTRTPSESSNAGAAINLSGNAQVYVTAFANELQNAVDMDQGVATTDSVTFASATVNGNITVTGTVDGRDVAADGTKLDGIEAGATADQTAAEIKTAYESNANTNAFTDAEQTKLAGIEAGADVTDAANVEPLVDAHLNVSGASADQVLSWSGTDYQWSAVSSGVAQLVASGAITAGDSVVVNSDGTVSSVSGQNFTFSSGPSNSFDAGSNTQDIRVAYDPTNQVMLVVWWDSSNSTAEACAATISGQTITFGTPVTIPNGSENTRVSFDPQSGNFVIIYRRSGNNYGEAVVASVSGTTVTLGTAATFFSNFAAQMDIKYDPVAQKHLIIFADIYSSSDGYVCVATVSGTSVSFSTVQNFTGTITYSRLEYDPDNQRIVGIYRNFASDGAARVFQISGSSVNWGSESVFETNNVQDMDLTYDTANDKFVIVYRDDTAAAGKAVVGTATTSTISFGNSVNFSGNIQRPAVQFDSASGKVLVGYVSSFSSYAEVNVGQVSGTSITFDASQYVLSNNIDYPSMGYIDGSGKVLFCFWDRFSGNAGGVIYAVQMPYSSTNLTENNFVGFASGSYSDTQTASINIVSGTNASQTGLTAGSGYYVQFDGSLSTTAGTPSVYAGVALSSTSILVKG